MKSIIIFKKSHLHTHTRTLLSSSHADRRIPWLSLSRHPSQSFIARETSSKLHPVSILANTGTCSNLLENVFYEFVLTSRTVPSMSRSSYLDDLRWEVSGRTASVLKDAAFSICSKQHVASFCSSHQVFSPQVSLEFSVDTFAARKKSGFYMIYCLSIALHIFARSTLIYLSVDEMLPPRYVNLSTNFRGLPLITITPCLKHMYSVLFVLTLWAMLSAVGIRLGRGICEKR